MIVDWLAREGWIIVNWWLLVTIAGFSVLPMVVRLLNHLPDHGYTLARPIGMVLIAFVFWFLAILGFIENSAGNIILSWLIVLILSVSAYTYIPGDKLNWRGWWQDNRRIVIFSEILFVVLLVGWAVVRAYQHNLTTTEKPMDLAFMSAIQYSKTFPPVDPWLSGYAISYYYFGYIMAAMMTTMAGAVNTVGYNMQVALLFALSGTTAFGVTANLIRSHRDGLADRVSIPIGVLSVVFMVFMGNFQLPLVEIPYQTNTASSGYLEFWDTNKRREPLADALFENPGRASVENWDYWWFFWASRAISDKSLDDGHIEVIAEFPQFSFLLADSHPHVMTLPFAIMAMGLALNVLLSNYKPGVPETLFYGVVIGAFIFLNTWDAPIYIGLLIGADVLRRIMRSGGRLTGKDIEELLVLTFSIGAIAIVCYLPFLVGFRSQLGGVLPNVINPTQSQQLFLMFGPFILLLTVFLVIEWRRGVQSGRFNRSIGVTGTLLIFGGLLVALLLITVIGRATPSIYATALRYIETYGGFGKVIPVALERRLISLPFLMLFGLALFVILGRLVPRLDIVEQVRGLDDDERPYTPATGFALLLIAVGIMLVLIPEFVYLRDNFSTRMNTVFKFYYQAWAVFSISSAYGVYVVLVDLKPSSMRWVIQSGFGVMLFIILMMGLAYPVLGIYHRTQIETGGVSSLSLDGGPDFINRDDYEVIMCLKAIVGREKVVVAESNPHGNNYNPSYGRVGALTGIPVILGWPGHESQWRGRDAYLAIGSRPQDLDTLYTDLRLDVVNAIIDRYEIDYILYGATERRHYGGSGEEKFIESFDLVCESGGSRIYRVNNR